jgi:transcriptional regulator with XRE-family HTH domain
MTSLAFVELRKRAGLTQKQAAERLGVNRVTVARWETSKRPIPEMAARLFERIVQEERRRRPRGRA